MTDAMVVARKLAVMREHLDRVRRRRPDALEDLKMDSDRQDALAMSLLVVVQESLDLAFHLVTDEGWGLPASYAESFEILAKRGRPAFVRAGRDTCRARGELLGGFFWRGGSSRDGRSREGDSELQRLPPLLR